MSDGIASRRSRGVGLLATTLVLALLSACLARPDDDEKLRYLSKTIAGGLADQIELGLDIGADYSGLRAVIVAVDGTTVLEQYYGCSREDPHDIRSVTRSVLSTLVGIAVGEGRLRLDDPLSTLLPAYASSMTRRTSRATLRHVLTMTAGLPAGVRGRVPEFTYARDWVGDILASADARPGKQFVDADASAHVVSAILEQATGVPVAQYARTRLFDPLGIGAEPEATWPVDPQGHVTGYGGLWMRPADLAKIGQLYLDSGRWEGEQVLPADWVRDATINESPARVWSANGGGYGYLWWVRSVRDEPAYAALGYGGQVVEVVPSLGLVVVTAVDLDHADATDQGVALSLMTSFAESVAARAVRDAQGPRQGG